MIDHAAAVDYISASAVPICLAAETPLHACMCEHTHTKLAYNLWLKNIYVLQWLHKLSSFPGWQNVQALPPVAACFVTPAHFVMNDEWKKVLTSHAAIVQLMCPVLGHLPTCHNQLCFYHMQWEIINKKNIETQLSSLQVVQIKLCIKDTCTHTDTISPLSSKREFVC